MRPTVVFILGSQRSGTTLLSLVLDSCSWATSVGEIRHCWTKRGRTDECYYCKSLGHSECEILAGIHLLPREDAHRAVAERSGRPVVVDNSKLPVWAEEFVGRGDLDVRIVHLVRNPLAIIDARQRRHPDLEEAALLADWVNINRRTEDLSATSGAKTHLLRYEDLTSGPDAVMPAICDHIGVGSWEPAAIDYWKFPHHAAPLNGAGWLCHPERDPGSTGDPAFYAGITARTVETDERWKASLPPGRAELVAADPYARHMAERLGLTSWA